MDTISGDVTRLLGDLCQGNKDAESKLLALVYDELRRLAASYMRKERCDHTLQPTALVHEAYLRLVDKPGQTWQNRTHFFAIAAQIMRQILVDHARKRNSLKRGGRDRPMALDDSLLPGVKRSEDLVHLDEALSRLKGLDYRQSQIVELRFFAGLTEDEIGRMLGTSTRTIKREWRIARAWLYAEIANC